MKINIKIKYLILGLGIGIILSSTLYSIFPEVKYTSLDDGAIIERAKELGMVNLKESIKIEKKTEELVDEPVIEVDTGEEIEIEVVRGENSSDIAKKLYDANLIDDLDEFVFYAREKKVDKQLKYGFYKLKSNLSYDEIIKILLKEK